MSKSDLKLDWASHEAAKYACQRWHYSGCMPVGKTVKFGVWENNQYVGCVIYGRGANKSLLSPYGVEQTEGCELVRVALTEHDAPVSRIIAITVRKLSDVHNNLKLIVSFADAEHGHHGGIYQAGNWLYTGVTQGADEYLYMGKRWHGRAFRKSFGTHLNYLGKGLVIVKGSKKHRYLMPIDKSLVKMIKAKPYPKRTKQAMTETIGTAAGKHRPVRSNIEAA